MAKLIAVKSSRDINYQHSNSGKKIIFVAGTGNVGRTLLKQLEEIKTTSNIHVAGFCNSKKTVWLNKPFNQIDVEHEYFYANQKEWGDILLRLERLSKLNPILVDATGSRELAELYPEFFKRRIHVVTASKLANSGTQNTYSYLQECASENDVEFKYETNVGAGLPVISTIKNLLQTGDEIHKIEGVLSGTMTYIFSKLDSGESFSESLLEARALGYAEPDPRDDLSGEDIARKFLILARESGIQLERDEMITEKLFPNKYSRLDLSDFFDKLPNLNSEWKHKVLEASQKNCVLRYTGTFENESVRIGVEAVEKNSPIGQLTGTNNLLCIQTRRYFDQPIILQGPGAGKEVTASGLLSDILSIQS